MRSLNEKEICSVSGGIFPLIVDGMVQGVIAIFSLSVLASFGIGVGTGMIAVRSIEYLMEDSPSN